MTPLFRYEKVRRAEVASNICAQFCIDMIAAVPSREMEMRQWLAEEGRRMARAWTVVRNHYYRHARLISNTPGKSTRQLSKDLLPVEKVLDDIDSRIVRWERIEWEAIKCT